MRIFKDQDEIPFERTVVTVGSYDGVHRGHRLLLEKLRKEALTRNAEPLVLTFSPHPKKTLGISNGFLTTDKEHLLLLEEAGVENVVVIPFTSSFSNLTYDRFIKDVLLGKLHAVATVMGSDHTFGKGGEGRSSSLLAAGIEPLCIELLDNIGSTEIRKLVSSGEMEKAGELLGGNGYLVSTPVTDDTKILPPPGCYLALVDGCKTEVMIPGLPNNKLIRILKKIEK